MEKRTSLNKTKELIIEAVSNIKNPGTENLLRYLEESDFYTARCHSHHQFRGGLAHHALGTAWKMMEADSDLPEQSRFIVGLLHDICTSHHPNYDHIGKGRHGWRSVQLLKALGFKLSYQEYYAIKNHMHHEKHSSKEIEKSRRLKLWNLVYRCDHADAATQPGGCENPYDRIRRAFMNAFSNMGLRNL